MPELAISVAVVVIGCLVGLRMALTHLGKKLEHAPVVELEQRLAQLEMRLATNQMSSSMRR